MSLADYFVRALELQMHLDGIIGGLSTLQLSDRAPGTSASALAAPSSPDRMSLMTLYFPDEIDEHRTFVEIGDIMDGAVPHDEYIDEMFAMKFSYDVIVVDDLFEGPIGPIEGVSDFVDPPLSFDVLSGFVSRSDDVHDSSFMDLSIFEYLLVSHDVTLSTPSSPTSRIFDINDEIEQHNSDDDSSSVFDPSPND
ncbi:hypothetical protein AAG906_026127 [Vitis piasezkii]